MQVSNLSNGKIPVRICPLFNFHISEILYGSHTPDESRKLFRDMRAQIERGFEIVENIRIKRITKDNFERFAKSGFDFVLRQEAPRERIGSNTFILEITDDTEDPEEILRRIDKLILALRLYKEGNVFCKIVWDEEKEEVPSCATIDARVPEPSLPYDIDISEIKEIRDLAFKIDNIDFDERKALRIACDRFNRSYEEHREDDKIIDFMIAFESLFKPRKRVAHIGALIGMGCSMLIGRDERDRKKINDFLIKAYDIRNQIVHGSEFVSEIQSYAPSYRMENFMSQLREYLVESIKKLI